MFFSGGKPFSGRRVSYRSIVLEAAWLSEKKNGTKKQEKNRIGVQNGRRGSVIAIKDTVAVATTSDS